MKVQIRLKTLELAKVQKDLQLHVPAVSGYQKILCKDLSISCNTVTTLSQHCHNTVTVLGMKEKKKLLLWSQVVKEWVDTNLKGLYGL